VEHLRRLMRLFHDPSRTTPLRTVIPVESVAGCRPAVPGDDANGSAARSVARAGTATR
jgi:hypothetical protein